jgi:hypothetical protein
MMTDDPTVHVRYMVEDVGAAVDFYIEHFGFQPGNARSPAFADITRGNLRLLISGPMSSAGRPMPNGDVPTAGTGSTSSPTTSMPRWPG